MQSAMLRKRTDNSSDGTIDGGFTLIELMVVVLIIAVLLAIAIPTFLGSQSKAKDRNAQSSLRNAVTAAKALSLDGGDYSIATSTALNTAEPSLTFTAAGAASTTAKSVSVNPGTTGSTTFYAAAKSATGTCFYVKDSSSGGTTYAKGSGTCDGTTAASQTFTGNGWS